MNDLTCMQYGQGLKALTGNLPKALCSKVFREMALLNVLVDVVKIIAQQLIHDE